MVQNLLKETLIKNRCEELLKKLGRNAMQQNKTKLENLNSQERDLLLLSVIHHANSISQKVC